MSKKQRFMKVYDKVKEKRTICTVEKHNGIFQLMSWFMAHSEVESDTEFGNKILDGLIEAEVI